MAESNENIVHVCAIEGLIMQASEYLKQIKSKTPKESEITWKAVEFLKCYQENQLKELRNIFE